MPVEEVADIALEPTGRVALIVGYAAIHLVDLTTMAAQVILHDNRTERRGVISSDGRRAAVFDHYAPCLHVFDLEAGTVETRTGSAKGLRRQLKAIGKRCTASADARARIVGDQPRLQERTLALPGGPFKEVRGITRCTDGRVVVAGTVRADLRAEEPALCLAVFDPTGAPLGTLALANRRAPDSHVYVQGRLASIESLQKMGITVSRSASPEARTALTRFVPTTADGFDEVVFGRLANGMLARLDVEAPLGDVAFEHEQPARVRRGLCGEALPAGPLADAAEDAAQRLAYWGARLGGAADIERAVGASQGLTHLLPEMERRLSDLSRKAWRRAVDRVGKDLRALDDAAAAATLAAMGERLAFDGAIEALAAALDRPAKGLREQITADREAVERVTTACGGAATLDLSGRQGAGALVALVRPRLGHLEVLELADTGLTTDTLTAIFAASWPKLQRLGLARNPVTRVDVERPQPALVAVDLRQTALDDGAALALAGCPHLPALTTLALPDGVGALGRAALHLSPRLAVRLPGDYAAQRGALLVDPRLDRAVRQAILVGSTPTEVLIDRATLGGAPLVDLIGLADASVERLLVRGYVLQPPQVLALEGAGATIHLEYCRVDLRAAERLAELGQAGRGITCEAITGTSPRAAATLWLAFQAHGFSWDPEPSALSEALLSRSLADETWSALWSRRARASATDFDAVVQAAGLAAMSEMIGARPARAWTLLAAPARLGWEAVADALSGAVRTDRLRRPQPDSKGRTLAARGMLTTLSLERFEPSGWAVRIGAGAPFDCGPEPRLTSLTKLFTGQDVLTGDRAFDGLARIAGPPLAVVMAMTAESRAAASTWLRADVRYEKGAFSGVGEPPERAVLADLLFVGAAWAGGERIDGATLCARLAAEPLPGVRARLALAVGEASDLPEADKRALLEEAARDTDAEVRAAVGEAIWPLVKDRPLEEAERSVLEVILARLTGPRLLEGIERIGQEGDERSIAVLTQVGTGLLVARAVKDATRRAIEAITRRIGGLRSGGLAVVDGAEGGLTLDDRPDG